MNQTSSRNVRSLRRKAYRVGIIKNLFTMAKTKEKGKGGWSAKDPNGGDSGKGRDNNPPKPKPTKK